MENLRTDRFDWISQILRFLVLTSNVMFMRRQMTTTATRRSQKYISKQTRINDIWCHFRLMLSYVTSVCWVRENDYTKQRKQNKNSVHRRWSVKVKRLPFQERMTMSLITKHTSVPGKIWYVTSGKRFTLS